MGKIIKISNLKKTVRYLKKNGIRQAYYAMRERVQTEAADHYTYEPLNDLELRGQAEDGKQFRTKFSVLVPTFETKEEYLRLNGLGEVSYMLYGKMFIEEIKKYYHNKK